MKKGGADDSIRPLQLFHCIPAASAEEGGKINRCARPWTSGGGAGLHPLIECIITEVKAGEWTSLRVERAHALMTSWPGGGRGSHTASVGLSCPAVEFKHLKENQKIVY